MPVSTIVSLPLAELIEDLSLYPRHAVDEANVARLVRALEAGFPPPPIIADKASKRIVDGWHRSRAYRQVLGPTGVADVDLRPYANEKEMFLAAIELNASHGRQLDKMDQVRCVTMAERMGIELKRVAVVLHQPEESVRKLVVRVAIAPPGTRGTVPGTNKVVLKRPVQHLSEQTLTKEQAQAQVSVPGTSYKLLAKQLTDAVRLNLANRADTALMETLRELRNALIAYFAKEPQA